MPKSLAARIDSLDWPAIQAALDADGHAVTGPILTAEECADLAASFPETTPFRSHIQMTRHGYGSGEYKYFAYPLPEAVATFRTALYPHLAETANRWQAAFGGKAYPTTHEAYLKRCHDAGQRRPTPLLLKYEEGDYNRLHQDLYGEFLFPLQATIVLSTPERDFTGGEFMLTEQRPRMQSRGTVVALRQGEAVLFAVNQRPIQAKRGVTRATLRHGVSRLKSGRRFALGIILHDAK